MDRVYERAYRRQPHPVLRRCQHPRLQDDPLLGRDPARLFRRLYFCSITSTRGASSRAARSAPSCARWRRSATRCRVHRCHLRPRRPTANMYRLACRSRENRKRVPPAILRLSGICPTSNTDHAPLVDLYRKVRELPGIRKVLIASGVRYDLAVESPEYVKELAEHHTGGYLKIAPEAIAEGPLSMMMKPESAPTTASRRSSTASRARLARSSISSHTSSRPIRARPMRTCSSWHCG